MNLFSGIRQRPDGHDYDAKRFLAFQVNTVLNGSITITSNGAKQTLSEGETYVLPYESSFHLSYTGDPFRAAYATLLDHLGYEHVGNAGRIQTTANIRTIAGLIETEATAPGDHSRIILDHLGLVFIGYAARQMRHEQASEEEAQSAEYWAERVRHLIEGSVYSSMSTAEVLSGLRLSYRQLVRHFRSVMHITPKQYQIQCRIDRAKHLLATTDLSVTAIALDLGFSSSQNFATQFAHVAGMTPTEFRSRVQSANVHHARLAFGSQNERQHAAERQPQESARSQS
jgi:AraC-like DNA-binding protein